MSKHTVKRPILADVARLARVSTSTASRVLRGKFNPRPVSLEVQRRVLEAAQKLGYHPHPIAQALATRQTHILGLVLLNPDQLTHPYSAAIIQGALEAAHAHDYHLTLIPTQLLRGRLSEDQRLLNMTDGLIITTRRSILSDDLAQLSAQIPIVLVQFRFPGNDFLSVHVDYRHAAHLIADHLIDRNYHRVGILWARGVTPYPRKRILHSVFEQDFIPTLKERLAKTSIRFTPGDIHSVLTSTDVISVRREVRRWLRPAIADRPLALCVADDFVAGVVLQVAQELDLQVPHDLGLISLNDLGVAETLLPPVTALHIAPAELGRKAAGLLIMRLKRPKASLPFIITVRPSLTVRASS